ncbi:MAG: 1-deoxy-D-xylulose-5-phosphate reductoisomerase [Paramuribaculum sp.]|nr:1-deoxy-D-xylulose-5-phosphate reductoisomerase [Paramuribaculum sp.]
MSPKNIAVLGSTGSIGTQALDIIAEYPHLFRARLLAAGSNVDKLVEQCRRFRPSMAIIADQSKYSYLRDELEPLGIATACGADALSDSMERDDFSTVLTATVGYSGLAPTMRAIQHGKDIALANKETLVVAGEMISRMVREHGIKMLPVDSEHSAIYQCMVGENQESVSKLIITASGGPFRTRSAAELQNVTVHDALRHPNWNMGAKITIDSATMLNKAFEIIEARWLFDIPADRIEAVVHPQSIIHSMVQFCDGAVKAQLGLPDMHLPIRYALGETVRLKASERVMTLADYAELTFEKPDYERFPCLGFAHRALNDGGTTACVVNAANEVAVAAFLGERIKFRHIYDIIEHTLGHMPFAAEPEYEDYVNYNTEARRVASEYINTL